MSNLPLNNQKPIINLNELTHSELIALAEKMQVLDEKRKYSKIEFLWPKEDRLNPGYRKHMLFMKAGKNYRERALIAGNRTGKTRLATIEGAYHLTGLYPEWWEGRKFDHPIKAWFVGKTHDTTKNILQQYLYGDFLDPGTGWLPKETIIRKTAKLGTPDALQDIYVKHRTNGVVDGVSVVTFKSYVQGTESFMGDQVDFIHLDEEPDSVAIYPECLTRTMTTGGMIVCTFTPTEGLTDTVLSFLPNGKFPTGGIGVIDDGN